MRTARLHGARDLRLHDEDDPATAADEVRLRVTAVGLCGSDRHWYEEGSIGGTNLARPLVLGHEVAAVIDAGPDAGTRVVLEPAIACGRCGTCLAGRQELCPTAAFAGYGSTDGGLREIMTWPRRLLHPVPASVGDAEACTLEALGVALHAVDLASVDTTSRVSVVGCGPIGLLVIRSLRSIGVTDIDAWDPLPHRREAALAAGAARADEFSDETEVDVSIECSGDDAAVDAAVACVRPGGRVVLVGIPASDRTTFTASVARRKGLTLVLCRRMRATDLDHAIAAVADGDIDLTSLVTHRFPLDAVDRAFEALVDRRGLKVVVHPDRDTDQVA